MGKERAIDNRWKMKYGPVDMDTNLDSPVLVTRRMDEGPILNVPGRLVMFLRLLGLEQSTRVMFEAKVPKPKYKPLVKECR